VILNEIICKREGVHVFVRRHLLMSLKMHRKLVANVEFLFCDKPCKKREIPSKRLGNRKREREHLPIESQRLQEIRALHFLPISELATPTQLPTPLSSFSPRL